MISERDKKVFLKIIASATIVFMIIWIVLKIIPPPGHIGPTEQAEVDLNNIIKDINWNTVQHKPVPVSFMPPELKPILPDISKYPLQVDSNTPSFIEIFSSTEKAGSGTDGWLTEVARDFNNAAIIINGKRVSVKLRGIASGDGYDYITSGRHLPDAYTPSNELWGEMLVSKRIKAQLVQKRLAGNVAGILLKKSKRDELAAKYGEINIKTIIEAVANKELTMGYTDPFTSSTGLNFLISALQASDSSNLLSEKAIAGFLGFQGYIPVVAVTTQQLLEIAKSGKLDGFVLEYQTYVNAPEIRSYEFIPFGARHDSPMYAIGELSAEKKNILNKFVEFSQQEKYHTRATQYGFNGLDQYQSNSTAVSGDVIIQAQNIYKDGKNVGKPICAVFVADVSGSMDGEPLNKLKRSLIDGQYYIGEDNLIGLISYSSDVHIDLPIAKFDLMRRSLFAGAVSDLQAGGNTATFNAIAIALKMLIDQKAIGQDADPNLKPKIFLLSDGETNRGHLLEEFKSILDAFGVPVYTIGYNANIPELQKISQRTEGACINADNEDVAYKIRKLFNGTI
jgi:Ca-activated chloride channel family protein